MTGIAATLQLDAQCTLGEGPVWHGGAVWFVDIEGRRLHRYDVGPKTAESFEVPGRIGFAAPTSGDCWLIAQDAALASYTPGGDAPELISQVEPVDSGTRLNDGKSDPAGRLFAGTMHLKVTPGAGSLYRFGHDGSPTAVEKSVTISNGLAWDVSRGVMYFIDTATGRVDAMDWCQETGEVSSRRPVATIENGAPDGMCIDRDGMLWVALWGGSRVACVDPANGKEVRSVAVDCPNVTSCCFGGEDLDQLWITTARIGLDDAALAAHPASGGLFMAEPDAVGLPTTPVRFG